MEQNIKERKKDIYWFAIVSIVLGWGIFLLIPLSGATYGDSSSLVILTVGMFTPAISSLLVRLVRKEGLANLYLRPNLKGNVKKYLVVFFAPSLLLLLSGVIYFLLNPSKFDPSLSTFKAIYQVEEVSIFLLLFTIGQVIIIGPVVNIIPTLGEELGWRGYLLPKLLQVTSQRKAVLISGFIWGFWHLPVIVMGHNYGTEYKGYPYLGIIGMIVFCMVLGIIEGYATIELNSVIPAAMIHSTINAGAALPIIMAKGNYNPLFGPTIVGLLGSIPFIVVAAYIFIKKLEPQKSKE
ncbi:MAG: type II CAAX prenyl endopeptidase Rce1 family protein [Sphaerochaetaceae bacterium]|jgi:membrane protease YdiL (CAAX protease family)